MVEQQGVCAPSRAPDASGVGGANRRRFLLCMGLFSKFCVLSPRCTADGYLTYGRAIIPPVMGNGTPVVAG